jgi:hypothetical protein
MSKACVSHLNPHPRRPLQLGFEQEKKLLPWPVHGPSRVPRRWPRTCRSQPEVEAAPLGGGGVGEEEQRRRGEVVARHEKRRHRVTELRVPEHPRSDDRFILLAADAHRWPYAPGLPSPLHAAALLTLCAVALSPCVLPSR